MGRLGRRRHWLAPPGTLAALIMPWVFNTSGGAQKLLVSLSGHQSCSIVIPPHVWMEIQTDPGALRALNAGRPFRIASAPGVEACPRCGHEEDVGSPRAAAREHARRERKQESFFRKGSLTESDARAELHVTEDAGPEVIRAAYRALSREHHPDSGGSTEKMQRLNKAMDRLVELGRVRR